MEPIRILLADDQRLFREGLAQLLRSQPDLEVVGEAETGEEAVSRARELLPDLILMDVSMPGGGGLEATRRIKEEMPSTRIVILTVSEEDHTVFEAVRSGAEGYLLKDIRPQELFGMLRGVFRGEAPISRGTAAKIIKGLARRPAGERDAPASPPITPREKQVLELVATGAANKEIAAALHISEHTVKKHLRNILEKLHLENRVQAALFAVQQGLLGRTGSSREEGG